MNKKIYKLFKIIIVMLFIGIVGVIGLYSFPNRDLVAVISTQDDGQYILEMPAEMFQNTEVISLDCVDVNYITIKNIRFYGIFKSICLKNIDYNELASYIADISEGGFIWLDDCLALESSQGIQIWLNEKGTKTIREVSESFLLERICMAEVVLIIATILWIICIVIEEKADIRSQYNHGPIAEAKKFFKDIKKYWRYMIYAARTDLKAEVANSYLNRLWWLLEPFFNMLVYVVVFGGMMGRSIENYSTFIFSALLMWNFFSKTINYSVKLIRSNKDIISKVYVPKFVILISNMFLNFFKLLFSMIVLFAMLLIFKVQISIAVVGVVFSYIVLMMLAFGIGMICLHFGVYVDDLSYAVGILLSMLNFLSGTFYDVSSGLRSPLNTIMITINPAAMLIDTMRNALLYQRIVNVPLMFIWFIISFLLCCMGIHIVYKNENGYVKVV